MKADITWQGQVHFYAHADSQHEVKIDGPPELGGQNRGARPMELMLIGLGGCAATDVIHILKKSRQNVSSCRVSITANRAPVEPKTFTKIHLDFHLDGQNLDARKAQRAVDLSSEKYCSASILMRRAGVEVTHSIHIDVEEE